MFGVSSDLSRGSAAPAPPQPKKGLGDNASVESGSGGVGSDLISGSSQTLPTLPSSLDNIVGDSSMVVPRRAKSLGGHNKPRPNSLVFDAEGRPTTPDRGGSIGRRRSLHARQARQNIAAHARSSTPTSPRSNTPTSPFSPVHTAQKFGFPDLLTSSAAGGGGGGGGGDNNTTGSLPTSPSSMISGSSTHLEKLEELRMLMDLVHEDSVEVEQLMQLVAVLRHLLKDTLASGSSSRPGSPPLIGTAQRSPSGSPLKASMQRSLSRRGSGSGSDGGNASGSSGGVSGGVGSVGGSNGGGSGSSRGGVESASAVGSRGGLPGPSGLRTGSGGTVSRRDYEEMETGYQKKVEVLHTIIAQSEAEIAEATEGLTSDLARARAEVSQLRQSLRMREEDSQEQQQRVTKLRQEVEDERKKQTANNGHDRESSDILRSEVADLDAQLQSMRREKKRLESKVTKASEEVRDTARRMMELEESNSELEHQLSLAQVAVGELSSRCEYLQREYEDLTSTPERRTRANSEADVDHRQETSLAEEASRDRDREVLERALADAERRLELATKGADLFRTKVEKNMSTLVHERNELRREVQRLRKHIADSNSSKESVPRRRDISSMGLERWLGELAGKGVEVDAGTVILGAANDGNLAEAQRRLATMQEGGHKPTAFMYSKVVTCHINAGDVVSAESCLRDMMRLALKVRAATHAKFLALCLTSDDALRAENWLRFVSKEGNADSSLVLHALNEEVDEARKGAVNALAQKFAPRTATL
eukprot:UC1_evm3s708